MQPLYYIRLVCVCLEIKWIRFFFCLLFHPAIQQCHGLTLSGAMPPKPASRSSRRGQRKREEVVVEEEPVLAEPPTKKQRKGATKSEDWWRGRYFSCWSNV